MKKQYCFGHTRIEIRMPDDMTYPKNLSLFESDDGDIEMYYDLTFAEELQTAEAKFREENPECKELRRVNMKILSAPERECRILSIEGSPVPYAVVVEEDDSHARVWVSEDVRPYLHWDTIFISLLQLEKVMIRANALILHSAYMLKDGKTVLFSAPSGTGKSTQAGLWEQYRGTRQVNGDKSLLIREPDGWYAHGWPICGSSEICHNEAYPIQAIVMLRQAKENEVARLKLSDSIKKVLSQVTINMWNTEFQLKALDLIQELTMEIPVYELACDISEEAVKCLENILD